MLSLSPSLRLALTVPGQQGSGDPELSGCSLTYKECADPENHKVRQKLKAKEWDEFLAKGKRFHVLQPVKIGCVWVTDTDSGAELKVLQQFTACLLEMVPSEEEQTPKTSRRERRDQHSEYWPGAGTGGGQAPAHGEARSPGPRVGDFFGKWVSNFQVQQVTKASTCGAHLFLLRHAQQQSGQLV